MINRSHLGNVRKMFQELGEDVDRPGLEKTPERYLKSLEFLCSGYETNIEKLVNGALYEAPHAGIVLIKSIEFYSLCEHHLLPFFGKCHVGYIPDKTIIGLSKVPRIVDVFARRLQVQERLTQQIAAKLTDILQPKGVAVFMEASHLCMMMRGVEKQGATTASTCFLGEMQSAQNRQEFLQMVKDS